MNAAKSTVTLHMVSSLDGFIAKKDNSVSWLESAGDAFDKGVSEQSAEEFVKTIDCYVLGARTYEHVLELGWPYGNTPTVVVTHRTLASARNNVEFYSGDLRALVDEKLTRAHRNIWVVGGAALCRDFLRLNLVDEIRLSVAPILLGEGLPLFDDSVAERALRLEDAVAYKTGFVELCYRTDR